MKKFPWSKFIIGFKDRQKFPGLVFAVFCFLFPSKLFAYSMEDAFREAGITGPQAAGMIQYCSTVSRSEGSWGTISSKGCVGAFQFCPFGYLPTVLRKYGVTVDQLRANPAIQVKAYMDYLKEQWGLAKRNNITDAIGKDVCISAEKCHKATQSSILKGCQFGCGRGGAPWHYVHTNNLKCFPDRSKKSCGYAKSGTDGFCTCTGTFMYRGACKDISYITGLPPDVKEGDDCKLYAGQPYDAEKNPLMPGIVSSDVNPVHPGKSTPINCVNLRLQRALTLAAMGFKSAATAAALEVYRKLKYNDKSNCLLQITTYFDAITNILQSSISLLAGIVFGILNAVLSKVCEFIITGINNLLVMKDCLPVPNLGLSLSLPSLQRKTCKGVSLGDFISVSGGYSGYGGAFPGSLNPMMLMEPRRARRTTVPVF